MSRTYFSSSSSSSDFSFVNPEEKSSREQKSTGHHQMDKEWRVMSPFLSANDRIQMRTALYKLWNGVLANVLDGEVVGILDQYQGSHHISKLSPQYLPLLNQFKQYLLYDRFKAGDYRRGNVNEYTKYLIIWKNKIEAYYENIPKEHQKEAILEFLKQDSFIKQIREHLELTEASQIKFDIKKKKDDLKQEKPDEVEQKKPENLIDKLPHVKSDSPSKVIKKKPKKLSPDQLFIKGLMAEIEGDYEQAIESYEKAAAKKHVEARYNLGNLLASNIRNKEDDVKKAIKLYQELSNEGHAPSNIQLGWSYFLGQGIEKDYKKALQYLKKAAQKNEPEAFAMLGMIYIIQPDNIEKNAIEAFKNFKKGAELNSGNAIYNLGVCYNLGMGEAQNKKRAYELYSQAADKKHEGGLYSTGMSYYEGIYKKPDLKKALEYWLEAAEQNHEDAVDQLINYYKTKEGANPEKLLEYQKKRINIYKQHINEGDWEYLYELAKCYSLGEGVEPNLEEEINLYKRSAQETGREAAWLNLSALYILHQRNPEETAEGIKIAKEIAVGGKFKETALLNLINYYEKGPGINPEEAEKWHQRLQEFEKVSKPQIDLKPLLEQKKIPSAPLGIDASDRLNNIYKIVGIIRESGKPPEPSNIVNVKAKFTTCLELLKYKNTTPEEQKKIKEIKQFLAKNTPKTSIKPSDNSTINKKKNNQLE